MENAQTPFQAAIKAGLITGLFLTAFSFVCYFIDYKFLAATWLGLVTLAIYCGLIIYFGIEYRKELGGFMSFGTAFQFSFFSLLIMLAITTIGNMLLFMVLDPSLGDKLRSEEHTSELQSRPHLVCRLLLEKKKNKIKKIQ